MSNRILENPIYQEYYTSSLQRWNQIFNEVDTIWKKTTWSTKIEKKRTEIRRQVKTKLDILLKKTNMYQVNIDQIITKIEKIENSQIEINVIYQDENQIQNPDLIRGILLEYIEKICSKDKEPQWMLYPNELLHLQISIEKQQLFIQIKNKKAKLPIYFQNITNNKKSDIEKTYWCLVIKGHSRWSWYKGLEEHNWYFKYFLQNEGAFDNHVAWYIEYQTIAQLKVNIDQLNLIWNNYWKQKLYVPFLNKVIIILLFDIWEFMCSLKYLIQNNFFLDKQDKTNYKYFKKTLNNKMKTFKSDILEKEPTYQKIKYFRNLVIHPGGFNYRLQKQQFDLPINYPDNYIMPWIMLHWRGNKDNLHFYNYELSNAYHGDPILKNGIQISSYINKKGKRTKSVFYPNVKDWKEKCLFNLSIKTINKVKEFLQDDLSKIN